MAILRVTVFDPSMPPANGQDGSFKNILPNNYGFLLIFNDSMINIIVKWGTHAKTIVAGTFDVVPVYDATELIYWNQDFIFPNIGQAPSSRVIVDGATIDEEPYIKMMSFPVALPRVNNLGNTVPVATSATSVVNDGNAVGTQVLEATPTGAGGSQALIYNDGTGKLGKGNLLVNATQLSAQGGYTIDVTVLSSGVLPAGVTVAAAQVGSGYPAASIGSGVLGAGVTLPATQVSSGLLATNVEMGTSATNKVSMSNLGGGGQVGIISSTTAVWLASNTNIGLLYNAYFDGTNYKFMTTGDFAAQYLLSKDALGGTVPRLQIRYSSVAGTAGATITWNAYQMIPEMLNNNGLGGTHIFTGTTTPSGAVAGDLWFNG
jgi:hypothetical protein